MDPIKALIVARFACIQAARFSYELPYSHTPKEAALLLALQNGAKFAYKNALKYIPLDELNAECTIACSAVGGMARAFPRRDGTANL